jgi:polyisoprenoid-binding protein YceI
VTATIDLDSVDTGVPDRDEHLRSADFFEVAAHPTMTYRSTGVRIDGDGDYVLEGELTLKGVTLPVSLRLEVGGFGPDPHGGVRAGFTASGEIRRSDFGVAFNPLMETGGALVGDKVQLHLEIEAILQQS